MLRTNAFGDTHRLLAGHAGPMPLRRIAIAGDVMLGRLVDEALAHRAPEDPWREILPLVATADAFLYNLECAVCRELPEWEPLRKPFHFRLDPARRETLLASRVSAVQIANNHVMDHGEDGLLETLATLDELHIPHAGAGRTLAQAKAPAIASTSIALVSAADHPEEWAAGTSRPGMFVIDPASPHAAEDVAASIRAARAAGAAIVVLGLHWGPNMRRFPPPAFERFAHRAIDAGATIVWGTSAHLFQAIEFRGDGVILYDTGDFLDDYAIDPTERNDLSFLFIVEIEGERARCVDLTPVVIDDRRVRVARGEDAGWAAARMKDLCALVGTQIARSDGGWKARPTATQAHAGPRTRSAST